MWTSSTVTHARQDDNLKWHVTVQRADGSKRKFCVDHLVLATGQGAGMPRMPNIPGRVGYSTTITPPHFNVSLRRTSRAKFCIRRSTAQLRIISVKRLS